MSDFIYHRRRKELVELLERKGISDEKVLEAKKELAEFLNNY